MATDLTVEILRKIRDGISAMHHDLSAKLDQARLEERNRH